MENHPSSKDAKISVRFFGSDDCQKCLLMRKEFEIAGIIYNYVDIIAEDMQKLCDDNKVNEVPLVQVLNNNLVVLEIVGYINAIDINRYMRDARKFLPPSLR